MKAIDTNVYSLRLRAAAFNAETDQLLVSELAGSNQEEDLTDPPNCDGYGRIRHFTRLTAVGWPPNPLPMVPACAALGLPPVEMIRAQVFQNAACNWRCWYCFVPFDLLSANKKRSAWFTAAELVDMYLAVPDRPPVLDLSGGQPDLIPEWAPRTLRALDVRGVTDVYVWSDDNLSNDYFWRYLGDDDRALLASHPRYGRVACFKGFGHDSFMFNTAAAPELFDRQFELFARLAATGMDLYAYATFTTPNPDGIAATMARFVDRLQQISENLPLRLVPLQIEKWGPVGDRMREPHHAALEYQQRAIQAWWQELDRRAHPRRGHRAHRPAPARPGRGDLAQLENQRSREALTDRLRPLTTLGISHLGAS